jgi:hypothetical protein
MKSISQLRKYANFKIKLKSPHDRGDSEYKRKTFACVSGIIYRRLTNKAQGQIINIEHSFVKPVLKYSHQLEETDTKAE